MKAAAAHVVLDSLDEPRRRLEVRKPLREIHGTVLLRELRHHGEDRRADGGQFALERSHELSVRAEDAPAARYSNHAIAPSSTSPSHSPQAPGGCSAAGSARTSALPDITIGIAITMPISASPVISPAEKSVPRRCN